MTDHDRLAELLELADGERPLPPGVEDRLLAEVLDTARQPVADEPEVVVVRRPDVSRAPTHRRWWTAPRAAAAAVVACLALAVLLRPGVAELWIDDRAPVAAPSELSDVALCAAIGHEARAAGLLEAGEAPVLGPSEVASIQRLTSLLNELAGRVPFDGRPDPAAIARVELRLRSTALTNGSSVSARAAFEDARDAITSAPALRALLVDGCPGGLS